LAAQFVITELQGCFQLRWYGRSTCGQIGYLSHLLHQWRSPAGQEPAAVGEHC